MVTNEEEREHAEDAAQHDSQGPAQVPGNPAPGGGQGDHGDH